VREEAVNWKERNRELRFPTSEKITIAEGLGWVEASLVFFEEALASSSIELLLACGRVAYALHNLPRVLVEKLRGEAPTVMIFGPVVAMDGPPEAIRYCGIFFSRPSRSLMPALELGPDDPIFSALSHLYLWLRVWNLSTPESLLAADYQKERKRCLKAVRALLEHFELWIDGQPFAEEDFEAVGGLLPKVVAHGVS
jgi:hypothetical protein